MNRGSREAGRFPRPRGKNAPIAAPRLRLDASGTESSPLTRGRSASPRRSARILSLPETFIGNCRAWLPSVIQSQDDCEFRVATLNVFGRCAGSRTAAGCITRRWRPDALDFRRFHFCDPTNSPLTYAWRTELLTIWDRSRDSASNGFTIADHARGAGWAAARATLGRHSGELRCSL